MKRPASDRLGAAIALCAAVTLLRSEASAAPPERRCVELGKGCHCAEALDFEAVVPAAGFFDPPDSTSKECTQAGTPPPYLPVFLRLGGQGVAPGTQGAPALPAGAATKRVLREKGSGGADSIMTLLANDGSGGRLELTDKTLCLRGYVSYSEDHPVPGNVKIARVGTAQSGLSWQASWGGLQATSDDGSGVRNPPRVSFTADLEGDGKLDVDCNLASLPSAHPLTFADCRGRWCRYEICADHTPARPQVRARWTQLGGAASLLQGPGLASCIYRVPAVQRLYVNEQLMVMDLHGEQLKGSEADGARYLSHALVTLTPSDPSFWPGPARELEGP
jgi:hypothetical protein